jgi:hypothetical protein
MTNMNAKMSILRYLTKTNADGKQNTMTTAHARTMFKVKNIAARIYDLRKEGFRIYTNNRKLKDGRIVKAYRLADAKNVSQLFV